MVEGGDPGQSSGDRNRCRTVAVVPQVPGLSDGTGCESEGAFTPKKSPCQRMIPERPKARVLVAVNEVFLTPCLDAERILLYPDRQGGDDKTSARIPSPQ